MTLKRKCRRYLDTHDFGHIEKYIFEENKDLVNIVKDINKMQEPLKQLVNINRNERFKEVRRVYTEIQRRLSIEGTIKIRRKDLFTLNIKLFGNVICYV